MEDRHAIIPAMRLTGGADGATVALASVLDGHMGSQVSQCSHLAQRVSAHSRARLRVAHWLAVTCPCSMGRALAASAPVAMHKPQ